MFTVDGVGEITLEFKTFILVSKTCRKLETLLELGR